MELLHRDVALRLECIVERRQWRCGIAVEFGVALPHQLKSVVVKPSPDVQSMLLDALVGIGVAPARTLSPKAPAHLINGHFELFAPVRLLRDAECGSESAGAASENGDFCFPGRCHVRATWQ